MPLSEPVSRHPTSSLPLPAAPCGQQYCSVRLCSAPGRPPPPPPPPPAVTTHRSSLQGVETPELDTPHLAPQLSQPDRLTADRRTPEPEVGSVPGSHKASSRSVRAGCAALPEPLRPVGPISGPSSKTGSPRWDSLQEHLSQAVRGRGHHRVRGQHRTWGPSGGAPGWGPAPAEASLGTLPTGHGELKLESGEWEAADTAILCSLHPLRFHSPAPLT